MLLYTVPALFANAVGLQESPGNTWFARAVVGSQLLPLSNFVAQ